MEVMIRASMDHNVAAFRVEMSRKTPEGQITDFGFYRILNIVGNKETPFHPSHPGIGCFLRETVADFKQGNIRIHRIVFVIPFDIHLTVA